MNKIENFSKKIVNNVLFVVCQGDITKQKTDVIVNAANSYLSHGGGVAGAIVGAGGSVIQDESNVIVEKYGPVLVGSAVYTSAGSLNAKYIIHTVGPKLGEGDEENKLKRALLSVLNLSDNLKISSISIPAISTGIFGFPKEKGAKVIFNTVLNWVYEHAGTLLKEIRFCNIDNLTTDLFKKEIENL